MAEKRKHSVLEEDDDEFKQAAKRRALQQEGADDEIDVRDGLYIFFY